MARTIESKRVKSKFMTYNADLASGSDAGYAAYATWLVDDDIRVIGFQIKAAMNLSGAPAMQEGQGRVMIELSRGGIGAYDAILGVAIAVAQYWTEIVVAQQCAGSFGELTDCQAIMFPEGNGVDIDEGEYLYLLGNASNYIIAGDLEWSGEIHVYYVER